MWKKKKIEKKTNLMVAPLVREFSHASVAQTREEQSAVERPKQESATSSRAITDVLPVANSLLFILQFVWLHVKHRHFALGID